MSHSHIYATFRASKAWSEEFFLPIRPEHNNPHLYFSYFLLCELTGKEKITKQEESALGINWSGYISECRIAPGLFNIYPSGRAGRMSHDEIMGICFASWYFGRLDIIAELLTYLVMNDGVYNNANDTDGTFGASRFDVFRIVYLLPFIQATLGIALTLRSQVVVSAYILYRVIKYDKGAGGDLRTLMLRTVFSHRDYKLLNVVFYFYGMIQNARNKGPSKLAEDYFGGEPYSEFLPKRW